MPTKCAKPGQSRAQHGGVQVRRGKNPRQGESLDKDTNKQYNYEQDTPAGRLILS